MDVANIEQLLPFADNDLDAFRVMAETGFPVIRLPRTTIGELKKSYTQDSPYGDSFINPNGDIIINRTDWTRQYKMGDEIVLSPCKSKYTLRLKPFSVFPLNRNHLGFPQGFDVSSDNVEVTPLVIHADLRLQLVEGLFPVHMLEYLIPITKSLLAEKMEKKNEQNTGTNHGVQCERNSSDKILS